MYTLYIKRFKTHYSRKPVLVVQCEFSPSIILPCCLIELILNFKRNFIDYGREMNKVQLAKMT